MIGEASRTWCFPKGGNDEVNHGRSMPILCQLLWFEESGEPAPKIHFFFCELYLLDLNGLDTETINIMKNAPASKDLHSMTH